MTDVLLDTNVVLRLLAPSDPQHDVAASSVDETLRGPHRVLIAPQVIIECGSF